ncbi:unnamed protein product [Blepharisma stoltei]|uniref:PH domain-containing protein n=1 Tax=Blepharisma stoltei TaxID=1481888 RepID=A0AAU9JXD5_9CILI|nr:unnamed protein product [Blepharisma stoltei]
MENTDEESFDTIIKEGRINKCSRFFKVWRRRWMVLTPHFLVLFKRQQAYRDKPTEKIKLRDCSTVKSAEEETKKDFAFRIDSKDRVFFFSAQDANDKEAWIGSIGRVMVRFEVVRSKNEEDALRGFMVKC